MLSKNLINIGLGTASMAGVNMIGANAYKRLTNQEIEKLLNYCFEYSKKYPLKKIMIDTSSQYGESEKRLSEYFLKNLQKRKKFLVSSKWGLKFDKQNFSIKDFSLDNLNRSIEQSIKLLGKIDLYYIHTNPSINLNNLGFIINQNDEIQKKFISLKDKKVGGIKYLGISVSSLENLNFLLDNIRKLKYLDFIQINAQLIIENPQLARKLNYTEKVIVLNSLYRKSSNEERNTEENRMKIFYKSYFSVNNPIILTGTRKIEHLKEFINFNEKFRNYNFFSINTYTKKIINNKLIDNINNDLISFFDLNENQQLVNEYENNKLKIIEAIVEIYIGSNKTRIGAKPDNNQKELLKDIVMYYVDKDLPIETILTWGPKKFYPFTKKYTVDLSELISLKTLQEIRKKILRIYPFGVNFNIFIEDFEGKFIEGDHLEEEFNEYISSFEKLNIIVGLNNYIKIIRTADLLKTKFDINQINNQILDNYKKLKKFWYESKNLPIEQIFELSIYKNLKKIGWNGSIDEQTRSYYINRLDKILGDSKTLEDKEDMTVRLLACVLLHRQYEVFRVNKFKDPVKLSFLKISGGPKKLMNGRIDIRTMSTDISKRHISPWASKACIRKKKNKFLPFLMTWRDVEENNLDFQKLEIRIDNNFESLKINTSILKLGDSD